jgi:hypothetical protein
MDWPALDALADHLRWKKVHDGPVFAAIGPVALSQQYAVDAQLLVDVTLGDIEYERELACQAGTERSCAGRRRKLAERAARLLSLSDLAPGSSCDHVQDRGAE